MSEDNKQVRRRQRSIPYDRLDMEMLMTEPTWGEDVTEELYEKLQLRMASGDGELKEFLWGLLGFYKRDLRLGNIDGAQYRHAEYFLNLAGDCLEMNCPQAFMAALRRVITKIELSQSYKGFLRKRQNTLTYENYSDMSEKDQQTNSLLGGKKKK